MRSLNISVVVTMIGYVQNENIDTNMKKIVSKGKNTIYIVVSLQGI